MLTLLFFKFKEIVMQNQSIYILDTNVLVHDPSAIFNFENSMVGIPITVLEELDKLKIENTQRGFSSREIIRNLDALRDRGSLSHGVNLDNGGTLQVLVSPDPENCSMPLYGHSNDNEILRTAYSLKDQYKVKFISKDLNLRVKANILGIQANDYLKNVIQKDQFYKGWITIPVPSIQLKKDYPEELIKIEETYKLTPNEFVILESQHNSYNYSIWRYLGPNGTKRFKKVSSPTLKWPLSACNPQQTMSLDLLLDDSIQLVTLLGPAGTGKTFLALLAALHKVLVEKAFEKILVTRPVIPLGPDIGYLPGDIQEKLHSWMQPIYDNIEFIAHAVNNATSMAMHFDKHDASNPNKKKDKTSKIEQKIPSVEDLIKDCKLSLEAITYMRGRSIPYQFIFIDEVQNLTPHEVKTLISRVGNGSKIVLAGDPYQIDSPYLDFSSNGLVIASNRFMGQELFGSVFLESSERSPLSKLAGELL